MGWDMGNPLRDLKVVDIEAPERTYVRIVDQLVSYMLNLGDVRS